MHAPFDACLESIMGSEGRVRRPILLFSDRLFRGNEECRVTAPMSEEGSASGRPTPHSFGGLGSPPRLLRGEPYLTKLSFFTEVNPPAFILTKYTPAASSTGVQAIW